MDRLPSRLGRPGDAAAPLARLLRHEVSQGSVEQATDHFVALAAAVPETVVDVGSLARIVTVLRTRFNAARGEKP